jgi:hypothetical protein
MGRLKSRLARSKGDQDIQSHLHEAEAHLLLALGVCDKMRRFGGTEIEKRRSLAVRDDLMKVLGALGKVGRITPLYDLSDRDLQPPKRQAAGEKK